jgi:hypothetical protein
MLIERAVIAADGASGCQEVMEKEKARRDDPAG